MVRFNPKARLDTSRMNEAGGGGGGGGGGLGGGGIGLPHIAGGGGVVGVIVAVIYIAIQLFGSGGGISSQALDTHGTSIKSGGSPWGPWFRSLAVRKGPNVAIVAVARKMAEAMYALLRDGVVYEPKKTHQLTPQQAERRKVRSVEALEALGYEVQLRPVGQAA